MVLSALEKAEILVEALAYIKEFYGKRVVIKYGGATMQDCSLKDKVMQDIISHEICRHASHSGAWGRAGNQQTFRQIKY